MIFSSLRDSVIHPGNSIVTTGKKALIFEIFHTSEDGRVTNLREPYCQQDIIYKQSNAGSVTEETHKYHSEL